MGLRKKLLARLIRNLLPGCEDLTPEQVEENLIMQKENFRKVREMRFLDKSLVSILCFTPNIYLFRHDNFDFASG